MAPAVGLDATLARFLPRSRAKEGQHDKRRDARQRMGGRVVCAAVLCTGNAADLAVITRQLLRPGRSAYGHTRLATEKERKF
jgi:hypothetical protein